MQFLEGSQPPIRCGAREQYTRETTKALGDFLRGLQVRYGLTRFHLALLWGYAPASMSAAMTRGEMPATAWNVYVAEILARTLAALPEDYQRVLRTRGKRDRAAAVMTLLERALARAEFQVSPWIVGA